MWQTLRRACLPLALVGLCFATLARSMPLTDAGPHVNYGWGEPVRLRHLYTASRHGLFSFFLRINGDGRVDGSGAQSLHSLLEIRAVAVRTVAIKGVSSSRYLCMEEEGRLHGLGLTCLPYVKNWRALFNRQVQRSCRYIRDSCSSLFYLLTMFVKVYYDSCVQEKYVLGPGQLRYSTEDCSFEEEMRPDGYNVYKSKKYGISVSLSSAKQRQQFKGKDFLPLSHFLPMINTVPVESTDFGEYGDIRSPLESDIFSLPVETDSTDPFGITSDVSSVQSPSFGK